MHRQKSFNHCRLKNLSTPFINIFIYYNLFNIQLLSLFICIFWNIKIAFYEVKKKNPTVKTLLKIMFPKFLALSNNDRKQHFHYSKYIFLILCLDIKTPNISCSSSSSSSVLVCVFELSKETTMCKATRFGNNIWACMAEL